MSALYVWLREEYPELKWEKDALLIASLRSPDTWRTGVTLSAAREIVAAIVKYMVQEPVR